MSPRAFFLPVLLGTSLLLAACQSTAPAAPSGPPVSPATEVIPQALEARLDTGTAGSVIDARNAREFERDGKTWVKFTLVDPATSKAIEVSRPVVRSSPIKDLSARRYVVTLHIRLGEIDQYTELSLADRSGQSHPLILGRNFLRDQALVDVSRRFTVPASKL